MTKKEKKTNHKGKNAIMWGTMALILLFIILSIYGAFLGSENAKSFFNSPLLRVFWSFLMTFLIIAFLSFSRLIRLPGLFLIHAGCILILAGAFWGSVIGLQVQNWLFGTNKIQKGKMMIFEGDADKNIILTDSNQIKGLPFYIKLLDFRIEYYKPEYLEILTTEGWTKIPVEVGRPFFIKPNYGKITIIRVFNNFRISINGNKKTITDDPKTGYNPALEIQIESPDKVISTKYVFERFPENIHKEDKLYFRYHKPIKDYISDVQIIKNGIVVTEKSIEVNHPLHFGGYHFYQSSYDTQSHRYTILSVVSDSGLNFIYAGYLALCIGAFWHFWIKNIFKRRTNGN